MAKEVFKPGQFKVSPIEGEEAARHRAMFAAISDRWDNLEDTAKAVAFAKAAPRVVIIIGAVFTLSAMFSAFGTKFGIIP